MIESDEIPSYQNQTQADIESERSRMNSVGSVGSFGSGSGHSDDALLPEVRVKNAKGLTKTASSVIQSYGSSGQGDGPSSSGNSLSPRRTNRENVSLLRGRHRSNSYEEIGEIPEYENNFPGMLLMNRQHSFSCSEHYPLRQKNAVIA